MPVPVIGNGVCDTQSDPLSGVASAKREPGEGSGMKDPHPDPLPKTEERAGLKTPRPRQRERVFAVYTTLTRLASLGCPLPKTGEGEGLKIPRPRQRRGSSWYTQPSPASLRS